MGEPQWRLSYCMGVHPRAGDGLVGNSPSYEPLRSSDKKPLQNGDSVRPSPEQVSELSRVATPLSKLVFDKLFSAFLLLALSPVLLAVALLILVLDGGPVFFAHDRVGRGGRPFRCFKFRTMFTDSEARLEALLASDPVARAEWVKFRKLTKDPRVSRLGALLRKTSLDELPQLWNVLIGDMSVVGPRPIVAEERDYYGQAYYRYIQALPGLTGPWQVSGRSNKTMHERVRLDTEYLDHRSFWYDLRIVARTIYVVLVQDGAR